MTSLRASHRWQSPYLFDWLLAAVLSVCIELEGISDIETSGAGLSVLSLLFMSVPLGWRRREPLTSFAVVMSVGVWVVHAAPYMGVACIMVAAYSAGAYSSLRFASLGVMVSTATLIDVFFHGGLPPIPDLMGPFVALIPLWLVGNAMRTRQLRIDASEERAARMEREQELSTRAALAEERARIARELHDVVAHSVSVMLIGAGAARQVLPDSPQQAQQALLAVEATGREAMRELRGLLDVIGEDDGAALTPQPGIEAVESLVDRVREAGLPVRCHIEGSIDSLPTAVSLAAYRIVQEGLTNALRYSGPAPTTVTLRYLTGELVVEVIDEGAARCSGAGRTSGRGIPGMQDRVSLNGGTLEVGPGPTGGFVVRARLPVRDPIAV